jgi:DNA-directed RNA polymerase specialized sigma24 family protein
MALLPQLAESTRVVAAMRWLEGLKYREISERTGLPIAEVVRLDREAQAQLLGLVQTNDDPSAGRCEAAESLDATIDLENREKR